MDHDINKKVDDFNDINKKYDDDIVNKKVDDNINDIVIK